MIWATVSSWSCFCWLYGASPSLAAKNIINLISVLTIWWCPCVVFSCVVGCESWSMKKAECWRIDAFELWCWRRRLRVPWTARKSNQSFLKEISPGCSLEGLILKLKHQYFTTWCEELTHLKRPWCWERLRPGGEGNDRGWDGWMASLTQWTWLWVDSGIGDGQGGLVCCSP